MSQIDTLVKHFAAAGAKLTAFEALTKFGISRLAPRIGEMERMGYVFNHKTITVMGHGGMARVTEYVLMAKPVKAALLSRPTARLAFAGAA